MPRAERRAFQIVLTKKDRRTKVRQSLKNQTLCSRLEVQDWQAVIRLILYTSSALQPRDRSLMGAFRPCRMGP